VTVQRVTATVSAVLLLALGVAVAEAALLVLVLIFSSILRLQLGAQVGQQLLQLWTYSPNTVPVPMPSMTLREAAIVASFVATLACGAGAAAWRYRHWTPA
jgi:Mg2+/Co2+ transporter CorB